MTLSRMAIPLPITVPINPDGTLSIHIDQEILFRAQNYLYGYTTGKNTMSNRLNTSMYYKELNCLLLIFYILYYKNCTFLAQCSMDQDAVTTFNNRRYNNEMPISCYQVLAQDCTPELKFMVLLKKDEESEQNHLNIKLADM